MLHIYNSLCMISSIVIKTIIWSLVVTQNNQNSRYTRAHTHTECLVGNGEIRDNREEERDSEAER